MENYNFRQIEIKWADRWVGEKIFTPDLKSAKNPFYALFMFPYPSAEGLHIGNFYAFTSVDVMAKYKKLKGYDVFEPIGFDAFGIHSENYALKIGETPAAMLARTIANFRRQLSSAGLGCDWTRVVDTTTPEYYKWTEWIFTKLFEKGLAYQKEALLNWCPSCKTVLADEQIEGGVCERCKTQPVKKTMKQWFFKITAYAQRLLDGLDSMDWSDITKYAQRNWIGRSEGAIVKFTIADCRLPIKVFTTRPDTLFGATYFVLAPEHGIIRELKPHIKNWDEAEKYIKEAGAKSDLERTENKEKTGVKLEGVYAVNPVNDEKIPVFIADYVLTGYGTGAIMAVPAHDARDYDFAVKYNLSIKEVVRHMNEENQNANLKMQNDNLKFKNIIKNDADNCFAGEGISINSGFLDGLTTAEAKEKMIAWLFKKGLGERKVNYRLRDWCISRQRYWGPPVPVVYCAKCGTVAVPEKDLPVVLPEMKKGWEPAGDGRGPLAKVESFMKTVCPKCGGPGTREADVMDNFLDSAWYFFRYLSPADDKHIFEPELGKKWLPVDLYVGGNEHAVLHLMYTRFITMALKDLGLIDFDNPFKRFRANGMILKDGKKMSKSKGNVINPEEYGEKVGYDALKTYLLFLGPLSEDRSFTDAGVLGAKRWADKVARLSIKVNKDAKDDDAVTRKLHKTIRAVEADFEEQKYNTAIARLMEMTNVLTAAAGISQDTWNKFIILTAPFLPALAEELWSEAGHKESIFLNGVWPEYDEDLAREETIELVVQVNSRLRDKIMVPADISEEAAKETALKSEKLKKWTEGKEILKVIYIKGRLVNIVVKDSQ
ncbi:leucine--tRNA ligase [Candidatus Falkowbacteria bacterium RIFOXYB2_FULL_47_14]|uniref:Leucine--tRNA ligase n=1 Tax=Candidatus Falkowbacteria bacterium RIFOXYA2_FULL_47_19 TaxID=1797994 RepID=A0A1F5SEK7_9BACT|nr:MAG: leucine--tRNA ligase [Candidatus Falkowbacteria bacterium RIFOXYA2_FULL_47_19]OGF35257.1 MAG: leucine--tRNA ligase [Candidatus Falkowbacteria bacterium RIFOXYC2_FULL_46_15]OGF43899.1 MAG: leucine--tRNA ligase [Candidatus Falkowbacteria bacterium RIFOXYB2_FULL_47_14]